MTLPLLRAAYVIGISGALVPLLGLRVTPPTPAVQQPAQSLSDTAQVEIRGLEYALQSLPSGRIILDTDLLDPADSLASRRSAEQEKRLAKMLGATVGARHSFLTCDGRTPRGCHLRGADAVVTVGKPRISGSQALIEIAIHAVSKSNRSPVRSTGFRLHLAHDATGWQVTGKPIARSS